MYARWIFGGVRIVLMVVFALVGDQMKKGRVKNLCCAILVVLALWEALAAAVLGGTYAAAIMILIVLLALFSDNQPVD